MSPILYLLAGLVLGCCLMLGIYIWLCAACCSGDAANTPEENL